ncbi:two-component sensor histidine kinase [Azoarcus sp. DD4]|uniref:sensor histidine kinase n=1 Tax=Azoarcus sp. DD4 TaxID=2027405 RepID=UPI00112C2EFD|nr:ATP-binding protein [Azoarcus sp. DD4]QDF97597.1 two-component sensor histidine kinase [Azoarcus sp. DD4]
MYRVRTVLPWIAVWLLVSAAGAAWLARAELSRLRELFDTDARIVHRLLSQQAVEHEAVLATLALLEPAALARPEQRLPAIYPRILAVGRREAGQAWPDAALDAAEAASRRGGQAVVADPEFGRGRYWLVLAGEPASYALQLDVQGMVPRSDWPLAADSPVGVELRHGQGQWRLQAGLGAERDGGWRFEAVKQLAAASQPFTVVAGRRVGWGELPWLSMAGWTGAVGVLLAGIATALRQRAERQRAEERLRLGQVARLNALGELAAGMAHELNQPLTAVLANTRAAQRLLADDPPEVETALTAMTHAAEQARRAAEVLARLRRTVERPELGERARTVDLRATVDKVLHLIEPECRQRALQPRVVTEGPAEAVGDPVAVEQIVHNLLMNALQALEQVPAAERGLELVLGVEADEAVLRVRDSGPGIAEAVMPRIFQPFFTTRAEGLGLGLSLCETLAAGMGGSLTVRAALPRGAEFRLALPRPASGAVIER